MNTSNKPGTDTRTISFTVSDLTSTSSAVSRKIDVISVNTPPVLSGIETEPLVYAVKQGDIHITSSLIVSDIDDDGTGCAVIEISGNYCEIEDRLLCEKDTSFTMTWDSNSGKMVIKATDLLKSFCSVISKICFKNAAIVPTVLERTITITYNDGKDNSNSVTRKIIMPSTNMAPVLTSLEKSKLNYEKHSPPINLTDSLEISDKDNMDLFGAEIKIASNLKIDEDVLMFTDTKNITGSYNYETGILKLNGEETISGYINAIKSITYKNIKGDQASKFTKKIKFTVWDGIAYSDTLMREIDVDGIITGIDEDMEGIPTVYSLQQNYPNPFNPHTVIKYGLPKPGSVKLIVYNILGEEISVLVNKEQNAGYYKINFDAGKLASGIYFYRIQSEDFSQVKKMLLVK